WELLGKQIGRVKRVATVPPPPSYVETYGMYTNPARAALEVRLKEHNRRLEFIDIGSHLAHLRMVKQPAELKAIQAAIDITIASIKEATSPAKLRSYSYEYELESDINRGFRRRGAGAAFESIVAGGE